MAYVRTIESPEKSEAERSARSKSGKSNKHTRRQSELLTSNSARPSVGGGVACRHTAHWPPALRTELRPRRWPNWRRLPATRWVK